MGLAKRQRLKYDFIGVLVKFGVLVEFGAMIEKDDRVLREFARRVRSRFSDANIWAFGSRVRGNAEPDSDLDVCVVIDRLDEAADKEIISAAWEAGFAADVVISTVTFSRGEFTTGPLAHSPLVQNIRRDGVAA